MRPPERIYLQIGDPDEPDDVFGPDGVRFDGIDEITWCADRIDDSDVEYVLAPREKKAGAVEEREGGQQCP